jgi:hypothetical protein
MTRELKKVGLENPKKPSSKDLELFSMLIFRRRKLTLN